jgi:hypothetical protein
MLALDLNSAEEGMGGDSYMQMQLMEEQQVKLLVVNFFSSICLLRRTAPELLYSIPLDGY